MEYIIKFEIDNPNSIIVRKNSKIVNIIACPIIDKGIDIIDFNHTLNNGYNYNFNGLVLITSNEYRSLYYMGDLIDKIKR